MYKITTYSCSIDRILGMHIYVGYKNLSKIPFGNCVQISTFCLFENALYYNSISAQI